MPRACLLFAWHAIHRQVIIEGAVVPLSEAASEEYFRSAARLPAGRVGEPAVDGDRIARRA